MEMKIERSRRKTLSLQILPNGILLVRAPLRMSDQEIQRFVEQKSRWIETHREKAIKNGFYNKCWGQAMNLTPLS